MSKFTDQEYLRADQYRDASNLNARVELHRRFGTNPYGWYPWIFDMLKTLPEQARVLELGSGPGHMWKECIDRIPVGWSITLSDRCTAVPPTGCHGTTTTRRATSCAASRN